MRKICLPLLLGLILNACAVQPINLNNKALESYKVPYSKLVIDDFSTETKIRVNDIVYVNGWVPAHEGFSPPLNKAFVLKLQNSLLTGNESGRVDISVMRVGYFIEKIIADDIVYISLFMSGRTRGIKCDADINVKTENDSRRMTLSHEIRRSNFENKEELRTFIETCQTDLIKQIATIIGNPDKPLHSDINN